MDQLNADNQVVLNNTATLKSSPKLLLGGIHSSIVIGGSQSNKFGQPMRAW
jgi:hypothetical protein